MHIKHMVGHAEATLEKLKSNGTEIVMTEQALWAGLGMDDGVVFATNEECEELQLWIQRVVNECTLG